MELKIVIIIGLIGALAADEVTTQSPEEWSEWKVLQEYPICFLTRTRKCLSEGCNGTIEYKYCKEIASWGEWGPLRCSIQNNTCFIARTRNCSVQDLSDCYSEEKNVELTVWGDIKSCPCGEGKSVTTDQGTGHWGEWNKWQCSTISNHCYIYRTRQCSVHSTKDCPPSDGSQIKLWNDTCPCQKDSSSSSDEGTGQIDKTHVNTTSSSASWLEWGSWECHHVNIGCMVIRRRLCSSNDTDCIGKPYQLDTCKPDICDDTPTTTGRPVDTVHWGPWECHRGQGNVPCVRYRHQICSMSFGLEKDCSGNQYEMEPCGDACKDFSSSIQETGQINKTYVTGSSSSASWLEWGQWECHHVDVGCMIIRRRQCSSNETACIGRDYQLNTCTTGTCDNVTAINTSSVTSYVTSSTAPTSPTNDTTSDIYSSTSNISYVNPTSPSKFVPPYWLEWSSWNCDYTKTGECVRFRNRSCSTDIDKCTQQLGGNFTDTLSCSNNICIDSSSSIQGTGQVNKTHVTGSSSSASWLEWGQWECHYVDVGCMVIRRRQCSSNETDCIGKSYQLDTCKAGTCDNKVKREQLGQSRNYDEVTTQSPEEWSEWKVLQESPKCFLIRTRKCLSEGCNVTTEYKYCEEIASWGEWGPLQCSIQNNTCFIARTRNCSVQNLTDCNSQEKNVEFTVWGDIKSCPCGEGKSVTTDQGTGHWGEWNKWQCSTISNHCYIYRTRQCSVQSTKDCPPSEGSQIKLWNDTCPCQKDSSSSSEQGTGQIDKTHVNTTLSSASWLQWGSWECHHVNIGCMVIRRRLCSSNKTDCIGKPYQLDMCKTDICGDTHTSTGRPVDTFHWSPWECHRDQEPCVRYRYQICKSSLGLEINCSGNHYDMKQCGDACKDVTAMHTSSVTSSVTSYVTSSTAPTSPTNVTTSNIYSSTSNISNVNPTSPTKFVSPYWLEWSSWTCDFTGTGECVRFRNRSCSTDIDKCTQQLGDNFTETLNCSNNICLDSSSSIQETGQINKTPVTGSSISASWLEWGQWECHHVDVGCVIMRRRQCSSNETACIGKHYQLDTCKEGTCDNGTITTTSSVTSSMATTFPTTQGISNIYSSTPSISSAGPTSPTIFIPPYWLEWSSWKCNQTSTGECLMSRNRNCSTDIDECTRELDGNSTETLNCSNSICPAIWKEWGNWSCKIGNNGSCSMTRTRECSTGDPQDCSGKPVMSAECNTTVCPDKVKLEQLGQCRNYVSAGNCKDDASTCGIITDMFLPICLDKHVSHDICPKACGCCEEEPYWSGWSDWKCHILTNNSCEMERYRNCSIPDECEGVSEIVTKCSYILCPEIPLWQEWSAWECVLAPYNTCKMKRSRVCSNSSGSDCVGESTMTRACDEHNCNDIIALAAKVDCSTFDSFNAKCEDGKGCSEFKTLLALDVVCSEPKMAADCPITCGCCDPLLAATMTTTSTTLSTETTFPDSTSPVTKTPAPVTPGSTSSTSVAGTPNPGTPETTSATSVSATPNPVTPGSTSSASVAGTPNPGTQETTSSTSVSAITTQEKTSSTKVSDTPNSVTPGSTSLTSVSATPNPVTPGSTSSSSVSATPNPGTQETTSSASVSAITTQEKTSSTKVSDTPIPVTPESTSSSSVSATQNPVSQETTSSPLISSNPASQENTSSSSTTSNSFTPGTTSSPSVSASQNPFTPKTSYSTSVSATPSPVTPGSTSSTSVSATPNPGTQETTSSTSVSATPNPVTPKITSSTSENATPNSVMPETTSSTSVSATPNPVPPESTSSASVSATPNSVTPETISSTSVKATPNPVTPKITSSTSENATPNSVMPETTSLASVSATPNPVPPESTSSASVSETPNPVPPESTSSASVSATPNSVTPETISTISSSVTTVNETKPSTSNKTTQAPNTPVPGTTTSAAAKTTAHKQPVTNPPVPVTCKVCAGPEFLCEKLYMDKQCEYPNNYCINKLTNHLDGSRSVIRSCGNFDTCYRDWFLGSSDSDKCRRFDENSIITLDFSCTFCCVSDNCNLPIRPNLDTLYIDV